MRTSEMYELINSARRDVPVDVERLATSLGVRVKKAYLDRNISGMIEKVPSGGYLITVNARNVETRQRFTIAHELGHFVLHRDLIGDGVDDDRAYRSTGAGKYHNTAIGPLEEIDANKFAAYVLMPTNAVKDMAETIAPQDRLSVLAERFHVSTGAMRIRLEALGLAD